MVERTIDGQKRVFKAPKQAQLTERGRKYLAYQGRENELDRFRSLTRNDLIELVYEHEERIEILESALETMKRQFQNLQR
jgi:hypothetical protein